MLVPLNWLQRLTDGDLALRAGMVANNRHLTPAGFQESRTGMHHAGAASQAYSRANRSSSFERLRLSFWLR
jgi:hypothetical protein